MLFGYLTLFTALIISLSAAVYSILGLTAIFAAAFWPVVIMGGSLEVGKIVTTLWLHKYWDRAEIQYKLYLCSAVAILMLLTSMGVFGFLSKAHTDQSLVSGDVGAKIAIYDEKIKISRDNIDANRKALKQMDEAVDQVMVRSTDEKGADKAVAIRRGQASERGRLLKEIDAEQKKITAFNEERAPIAAENRKVEAEVGPIKYIAALIYGDNPDTNVLERSVRWVIILIVIVFDPLALTLLLAATKALEWERGINIFVPKKKEEEPPVNTDEPVFEREEIPLEEPEPVPKPEPEPVPAPEPVHPLAHIEIPEIHPDDQLHLLAKRLFMSGIPHIDEREYHAQHQAGDIDRLPWHDIEHINNLPISDGERKQLIDRFINNPPPAPLTPKFVEIDPMSLQPDNVPAGNAGEVKGFGTGFPTNANKGDMFLRVDRLPSILYKFNGTNWIAVDKLLSDNYAYDDAYIDYLINKIDSGEYDPDLLSDAERESIALRLNKLNQA
jgi:hypothetical protein